MKPEIESLRARKKLWRVDAANLIAKDQIADVSTVCPRSNVGPICPRKSYSNARDEDAPQRMAQTV